jgi:hypothetical protein
MADHRVTYPRVYLDCVGISSARHRSLCHHQTTCAHRASRAASPSHETSITHACPSSASSTPTPAYHSQRLDPSTIVTDSISNVRPSIGCVPIPVLTHLLCSNTAAVPRLSHPPGSIPDSQTHGHVPVPPSDAAQPPAGDSAAAGGPAVPHGDGRRAARPTTAPESPPHARGQGEGAQAGGSTAGRPAAGEPARRPQQVRPQLSLPPPGRPR